MSARPYWLTSMLAVLLLSLNAIAQSGTAQPSGFVKDESGAVVTRAAVNVTNESSGLSRHGATHAYGYYVIAGLPAGSYIVTAEVPGFN